MNGSKKRGPPKNGLELINSYEWMNKLALFFSQSQQNEIIKTSNILNDVRFFGNPDQNSSEPLHILPIFNESPIFNDVRFLSDSGFLFSSKKTLCWGHPNILLHWIYIKKHMVAYENNKFRHDVHICQPCLISKAYYWPVWNRPSLKVSIHAVKMTTSCNLAEMVES